MRSLRRTRLRQRRDRGELVECFRVARLDRNFAVSSNGSWSGNIVVEVVLVPLIT
jgi:hypothetical protein